MALTKQDTLRNHWRPPAPDYLTWHLLFDARPALHAVASRYQRALIGIEGIEVVPTSRLHLTVQGVGPVDEIPVEDVRVLLGGARDRLAELRPFELIFQPAEVQWEGITLTAGPVEPLRAVRDALRAAIDAVLGADRVPGADEMVWPHVSLAYASAAVSAARLFDAIATVPRESVAVEIDQTALIALRRDGQRYVWSPVAAVPLGVS